MYDQVSSGQLVGGVSVRHSQATDAGAPRCLDPGDAFFDYQSIAGRNTQRRCGLDKNRRIGLAARQQRPRDQRIKVIANF